MRRDHSGLRVNLKIRMIMVHAGPGLQGWVTRWIVIESIMIMTMMMIVTTMMMLNLVERKAQPRRAGKSETDGEQLRIGIAADTEI